MSKFNTAKTTKTINLAGGKAFKESNKLEFISILLTSFLKDSFYESENETTKRLYSLLKRVDPLFAAKAAIYARNEFGMRSVSHLVASYLFKTVKGESWMKRFGSKIVHRPDDMLEILSAYLKKYKKPIPNSLKKGFATAINSFDEYQLAKYRGEGKSVSMVDLVNLIHVKPSEGNSGALKALMNGTLKSKDTWETKITKTGIDAKDEDEKEMLKSEAWSDLVTGGRLGYFALLRNMRNILENAPEVIDEAVKQLTDVEKIKRSLVLPFRFQTAMSQLEEMSIKNKKALEKVKQGINDAMELSLSNVPTFEGSTLIALDVSGSMEGKPMEIGSLFAAVMFKHMDADLLLFSDDAIYYSPMKSDSLTTLSDKIHKKGQSISSGTNFHSIFQNASQAYDRIIILSDMQGWMGYDAPTATLSAYNKRFNANPKIFSFDLNGYGTLQFPQKNIYALAGFSDKTLDIIKLLESDKEALIHKIEGVLI